MTLRMIAEELYRLIKAVEELEKALQRARPEDRAAIEERLRKARAERNRLRGILDTKKK